MSCKVIDLRSDTVTKPSKEMIEYMQQADLGDDVYSEDPTVNLLEQTVADLLGTEAALFVPTGVMSNQLCLRVQSQIGDEVIVGYDSHIFNYETAAPAMLSGVQLHTLRNENGCLNLDDIIQATREAAYYLPQTSIIALEQTHNKAGGAVVPLENIVEISDYAKKNNIKLHLDGARLWNASVATNISLKEYAKYFDSISICLSKGMGAPIGSLMCSNKENIEKGRHFRKAWGGGWRQAGLLAAAGLFAINNNFSKLIQDHKNAKLFYNELKEKLIFINEPQTNIVIFNAPNISSDELCRVCKEKGLLISAAFKGKVRAVFHLDISLEMTYKAVEILREVLR